MFVFYETLLRPVPGR